MVTKHRKPCLASTLAIRRICDARIRHLERWLIVCSADPFPDDDKLELEQSDNGQELLWRICGPAVESKYLAHYWACIQIHGTEQGGLVSDGHGSGKRSGASVASISPASSSTETLQHKGLVVPQNYGSVQLRFWRPRHRSMSLVCRACIPQHRCDA